MINKEILDDIDSDNDDLFLEKKSYSKDENLNMQKFENLRKKYPNAEEKYIFDYDGTFNTKDVLHELLIHTQNIGASDINIRGDDHIFIQLNGLIYPITYFPLQQYETDALLKFLYDDNAITKINQIEPIDTNYYLDIPSTGESYRFRINAVGCMNGGHSSIHIVIRTLPGIPKKIYPIKKHSLEKIPDGYISLEKEIWDYFCPDNGLVLVTGPTGSGKTTLLAAGIRTILEDPDSNKKIVTYEAPIEISYEKIKKPSSIIYQTEIKTQLESFAVGVESALRRSPDIILIGETRDKETIDGTMSAASTGHLVYTTLHTSSVAGTIKRILDFFEPSERSAKLNDLINNLQIIIAQRLIRTVSGGRCAIKEYLVFTDEVKRHLRQFDVTKIEAEIEAVVAKKRQRLLDDAYVRLENGIISQKSFENLEKTYGKYTKDVQDILDVGDLSKFIFPKEYKELDDLENTHIGLITNVKNPNYAKIVYLNNEHMDKETFISNYDLSLYYFKESKNMSGRDVIEIFKTQQKNLKK